MPKPQPKSRQYLDDFGRRVAVSTSIVSRRRYASYTRPAGLPPVRIRPGALPLRFTASAAQADLDALAQRLEWREIE